jgi:hypothetical protein
MAARRLLFAATNLAAKMEHFRRPMDFFTGAKTITKRLLFNTLQLFYRVEYTPAESHFNDKTTLRFQVLDGSSPVPFLHRFAGSGVC